MAVLPYFIPVNPEPLGPLVADTPPPPWVEAVQQQVFPVPEPIWAEPENLLDDSSFSDPIPTRNYKRSSTSHCILDVDAGDIVRIRVRRIAGADLLEMIPDASFLVAEFLED